MINIIKPYILILSLTLILSNSYAGECSFEPDKMFKEVKVNGKIQIYIDPDNIDSCVNEIAPYIWEYPPRFENNEQRKAIEDKLGKLIKIFEIFDNQMTNDIDRIEVLKRYGFVLAMSYNLNWPNSSEKTIEIFDRALAIDPEDIYTNLRYGAFLANSSSDDRAVKYLKKAINKGSVEAKLRLAGLYLREKKNWPEAKILYEEYLNINPKDESVQKILSALKSGNILEQTMP